MAEQNFVLSTIISHLTIFVNETTDVGYNVNIV